MKFIVTFIALASIISLGIGCNDSSRDQRKLSEQEAVQITDELFRESEERYQAYKIEIEPICQQSVQTISAIDLIRCSDFEKNKEIYSIIFDETDKDFSFLPTFCNRKSADMTGQELAECLIGGLELKEDETDYIPD